MFGIGSSIKAIAALSIVIAIIVSFWYISGLRADLAISKANTEKLKNSLEEQSAAMEKLREDQEKIRASTAKLNETINKNFKDVNELRDRFNKDAAGRNRDFGKTAAEKPIQVEKSVNRGSINALRCLEIASGSPLTDAEKSATKPNEINKECPSLANPAYVPAVK